MNFELSEEQAAFADALQKLIGQHADEAAIAGNRSFFSAALDSALEQSGFLDALAHEDFGPVVAALLVQEVSSQTAIVEAAASAFLRPALASAWPRPFAVIDGRCDRPARFLPLARSVVFIDGSLARICRIDHDETAPLDSFFAYPMGRLKHPEACLARAETIGNIDEVRRLLLVATASEISGALQGAMNSVVEHVKTRRQFGRPLGSFQAIQHRLAMNATTIAAAIWLSRKAAATGDPQDARIAAGYAQDGAPKILYDLHQFMGAMGLTLEHPLYSWSYRIKLLLSELGGASRHLRDVAAAAWN